MTDGIIRSEGDARAPRNSAPLKLEWLKKSSPTLDISSHTRYAVRSYQGGGSAETSTSIGLYWRHVFAQSLCIRAQWRELSIHFVKASVSFSRRRGIHHEIHADI